MTEWLIDDLLDELHPRVAELPDWRAIERAAARTRRLRRGMAVVVVALAAVPAAVAVSRVFEGTPAPPQISTSFARGNAVADLSVQRGFALGTPRADVAQARGVLEIATADGPLDLWAAPNDAGGRCWFVDFADDPAGPDGANGFGGCDDPARSRAPIVWGAAWTYSHPSLLTVYGLVRVPAERVELSYADGTTKALPVVQGFFLDAVGSDTKVDRIVARDAAGLTVATADGSRR